MNIWPDFKENKLKRKLFLYFLVKLETNFFFFFLLKHNPKVV